MSAALPPEEQPNVWNIVAEAVELITRPQNGDIDNKEEIAVAMSLMKDLTVENINNDLSADPQLRDQVLAIRKEAKTAAIYNIGANIAFGAVLILMFAGLVVETQAVAAVANVVIMPAVLGPFIYVAIIPALIGSVAAWRNQAMLFDSYQRTIALINNPAIAKLVAERRSLLQQREARHKEGTILNLVVKGSRPASHVEPTVAAITPGKKLREGSKAKTKRVKAATIIPEESKSKKTKHL